MTIRFEWDQKKAGSNEKKHGVTFHEAITVFRDPLAAIFDDERHMREEYREIIIGHSDRERILLVSFAERDGRVRIISARPATRRERSHYEQQLGA